MLFKQCEKVSLYSLYSPIKKTFLYALQYDTCNKSCKICKFFKVVDRGSEGQYYCSELKYEGDPMTQR